MPSFTEPIVAVSLAAGGHKGITLFAPPWRDADDEEWMGFLGDGAKIVLAGTPDELQQWIESNPDHDLADHPAWAAFGARGVAALEPADEAEYDFEEVYELAANEPTVESVSVLADIVDMAARIGDCCEDGGLRALFGGNREYQLLLEGEISYTQGKAGSQEWSALGNTIADTWARALGRIEFWLKWQGSTEQADHEAVPESAQDLAQDLAQDPASEE